MATILSLGCTTELAAAQERAVVQVGHGPYAEPPAPDRAVVASPPPSEPDPSVFRLHVGPVAATTGRGLGPGLGVAADFGGGTMGFHLEADWMHGEPSAAAPSPIAGGLSQYTGEFTIDLAHRGPLHPVFGIGFGYARVDTGHGDGGVGIGTARAGLEYALVLDDADVRFSGGVLGALPGPGDSAVADARSWAVVGAMLGVGF
jgi:hypothetical protein